MWCHWEWVYFPLSQNSEYCQYKPWCKKARRQISLCIHVKPTHDIWPLYKLPHSHTSNIIENVANLHGAPIKKREVLLFSNIYNTLEALYDMINHQNMAKWNLEALLSVQVKNISIFKSTCLSNAHQLYTEKNSISHSIKYMSTTKTNTIINNKKKKSSFVHQ